MNEGADGGYARYIFHFSPRLHRSFVTKVKARGIREREEEERRWYGGWEKVLKGEIERGKLPRDI